MLSKALVLASLGFMRNNNGAKTAGKAFTFSLSIHPIYFVGDPCTDFTSNSTPISARSNKAE